MPVMGVYGFAVFAGMLSYADWSTKQCFPSNLALAKRVGCSERQVRIELAKLEDLGFIEWRAAKTKNIKGVWQLYPRPQKVAKPSVPETEEPAQPAAMPFPDNGDLANEDMAKWHIVPGNLANDDSLYRKNENQNENQKDSHEPRDAQPAETTPPPRPDPPPTPPSIQPQLVEAIDQSWKAANPDVPVPWKGLAFARLKKLLADQPKWTIDHWLTCIRNRFASDGINPGDPPERFIADLPRFIAGPLDEFGKQQGRARAYGKGDRVAENVQAAIRNIRGKSIEGKAGIPSEAPRGDSGGDGWGSPFA